MRQKGITAVPLDNLADKQGSHVRQNWNPQMWLDLELDRLSLSPLRPKRPLPWPDPDDIQLARDLGFVDPITARPIPGTRPVCYEIVSGEKSWLTAQKAGLPTVSVIVREDLQNEEVRRLQRRPDERGPPDPIQEALALRRRVREGASVTRAGAERGYPRTVASHLLRLLRLDPSVQGMISDGALSVGQAKALVGLTPGQQRDLCARIRHDALPVRQVEQLARQIRQSVRGSPDGLPEAAADADPDRQRFERRLSEQLGVMCQLQGEPGGSGWLCLHYATLDILDGLLERLGGSEDDE